MLKILNAEQIRQADAYTITHEPITSMVLMERAANAFMKWFLKFAEVSNRIAVVCGTGNNGGDGLAIARLLADYNYEVSVFVVRGSTAASPDFTANWKRLSSSVKIFEIQDAMGNLSFDEYDILIDAIFGTGLSRPVSGIYQQVIEKINEAKAIRVAVDTPSGLLADAPSKGTIVKAQYTISFQVPKLAFLLPENFQFTGQWSTVRIGLDKQFIAQAPSQYFFLEKKDAIALVKPRNKFDHKGVYGKALLIAGSRGMMGAAVLSARAAMRSGLGLLTTHVPACGYEIVQTAVPESMVSVDKADNFFSTLPSLDGYDAIGIGPGLGRREEAKKALRELLQQTKVPMVLDADALNLMTADKELLLLLPANSILTPHPKEFQRLAGTWKNDFERLTLQQQFAVRTKCILVLKGAYTSIAIPSGEVYFNSTGNPGMATGGSGDVLTGILTGLLAQGYSSKEAAVLGVYLHGMAGDLAAKATSQYGLIASDIIDFISSAYHELE
jgi:NAD(P)H-hydrate epimerase